jgi:hypothetical protein
MRLTALSLGVLSMLAVAPAPALAELVYLSTGRFISVKTFRYEGDRIVLGLRRGGEIVCDAGLVEAITPDEVPHPEEEPEAPVLGGATSLAAGPADSRYSHLIDPLSQRHGVDPALVRAVVEVESNYEPTARSRKGAMGLMQLMPATARHYAVANPYDPQANLDAGIRHLRSLLDRFDVRLALAAYNAGEAAVRRYGGVPPFRETRDYVARVMRRAGVPAAGR